MTDEPTELFAERRLTSRSSPSSSDRTASNTDWRRVHLRVASIPACLVAGSMGILQSVEMIRLAVEILENSPGLALVLFFFLGIGLFALMLPPFIAFYGLKSTRGHAADARSIAGIYSRSLWGSIAVAVGSFFCGYLVALIMEGLLRVVT